MEMNLDHLYDNAVVIVGSILRTKYPDTYYLYPEGKFNDLCKKLDIYYQLLLDFNPNEALNYWLNIMEKIYLKFAPNSYSMIYSHNLKLIYDVNLNIANKLAKQGSFDLLYENYSNYIYQIIIDLFNSKDDHTLKNLLDFFEKDGIYDLIIGHDNLELFIYVAKIYNDKYVDMSIIDKIIDYDALKIYVYIDGFPMMSENIYYILSKLKPGNIYNYIQERLANFDQEYVKAKHIIWDIVLTYRVF